MRKLDVVPKPWAKIHKLGLKNLLRSEARALRALRSAVSGITDSLASALIRGADADEDYTRRNAIVSAKYAAQQLSDVLKSAILDARADARDAANKLLSAELRRLQSQLKDVELQMPPPAPDDADEMAAAAAADSFGSKWAMMVVRQILMWDPEDGSIAQPILNQSKLLDYRLRRIATTEVSSAFNEEHSEGAEWVSDTYKDTEWIPLVFKRWNAVLDARTCAYCRSHDGEIVPIGLDYTAGDIPGDVHPNCRCEDTLVFIPVPLEEANTDDQSEAA